MKMTFRIGDALVYLFILLLIAGSFAGLNQMGRGVVNNQVKVEVDGEIWGTYDIPDEGNEEIVRVDVGNNRYNLMTITSSGVSIKEANCPDQICVNWGSIKGLGRPSFVCPIRWLSV